MVVMLPINLSGERNLSGFAATTVYNIPPESSKLWAHLGNFVYQLIQVFLLSFTIFAFVLVFNYREMITTARTKFSKVDDTLFTSSPLTPLTVLMYPIPISGVTDGQVKEVLESLYPDIVEVSVIPDLSGGIKIHQLLK